MSRIHGTDRLALHVGSTMRQQEQVRQEFIMACRRVASNFIRTAEDAAVEDPERRVVDPGMVASSALHEIEQLGERYRCFGRQLRMLKDLQDQEAARIT